MILDVGRGVEETAGFLKPAGAEVNARDIEPGLVYERNGLRVTAIRVDHRAIAPAYGYRIDYAGRSVVLSGDTRVAPDLIEAAIGTQLLVHEVFQASDALLKDNPAMASNKTRVIFTTPSQGAEGGSGLSSRDSDRRAVRIPAISCGTHDARENGLV